jgi:hypothetical protein
MPIHDWTRVDSGLFHAFHQSWICVLARALNNGELPREYYALSQPSDRRPAPDFRICAEDLIYARKSDQIAVRDPADRLVAVIEIISPGNKASRNEVRAFVENAAKLIAEGVHLLVIDLFPPGERDPQGIHKAIWDEFHEAEFELSADKPLTFAAYEAGPPHAAYVELVAVGDPLPEMPLFLKPPFHVRAPLEATYRTTWEDYFPAPMKRLLEGPVNPR